MDTILNVRNRCLQLLMSRYHETEARNLLNIILESVTGLNHIKMHLQGGEGLSDEIIETIDAGIKRLMNGEPVQYVTGEAYFCHSIFHVDHQVLIPRPETEELVNCIIDDHKEISRNISILDIGTGSGCIAITLSNELPGSEVFAIDIDEGALKVAKKNNEALQADVMFMQADILIQQSFTSHRKFDVVVSNPPYVTSYELDRVSESTRMYEPELALFASDDDPLEFYKAIAFFGLRHLNPAGRLYFELNEFNAKEVEKMIAEKGYQKIELVQDMHGKDRILRCMK